LNQTVLKLGRKPREERIRSPEAALTHSVNHWIRVEAFVILHEGEFTKKEVAEKIGEDVKYVSGHMDDLFESGCIERSGYKIVNGRMSVLYRGVTSPLIDKDAFREMSLEERHDLIGVVIQSLHAESVSSYRNGKMDTDENMCLIWRPMHLDCKGREELLARQMAFYGETHNVENRSARRMVKTGEKGSYLIVAFLGFERGREGRPSDQYWNSEKTDR